MTTSHVFKLGKSTIFLHSDEFKEGYYNGFVAYPRKQQQPLTDSAVYELIATNLLDVSHTDTWNAGYIIGAITGIYKGDQDESERDAQEVQLGTITLGLNNWRFREGYQTGQEDYCICQSEREVTPILKSSDLLRYIAHHDPETNLYYFAEDEISAIEDTLGQLVGYLCAALFPSQERNTGALQHSTILQEA